MDRFKWRGDGEGRLGACLTEVRKGCRSYGRYRGDKVVGAMVGARRKGCQIYGWGKGVGEWREHFQITLTFHLCLIN